MPENFNDSPLVPRGEEERPPDSAAQPISTAPLLRWMQRLLQMGLGESLLRAATHLLSGLALLTIIWLLQVYIHQPGAQAQGSGQPQPTASAQTAPLSTSALPEAWFLEGILRQANLHTNIPTRPRKEIITYTVQPGDTVSGIADKFGLQPQTIFAANFGLLQDNPHNLFPGQELKILPVDGVYWEWLGGIPFGQWAAYFQVKAEDIINYPLNKIDPTAVGDFANANIPPGTWLIIPGGVYQYHQPGSVPLGVTRTNPASARVLGPGYCDPITGGAIGTGTFVWPTAKHIRSGYDYSTKTNHLGVDLAGNLGEGAYAADSGVIVYAGWNTYGYGNMVMIDHGNGFQTLYAHLSEIYVGCGQSVNQGQAIGAIGSTGRSSGAHLHFEVLTATTRVNPWDVLPPP